MEIEKKVAEVVRKVIGDDSVTVKMDSTFMDDLGMSSFDTMELVAELENIFSVSIPDHRLRKMICVKDIVKEIQACEQGKKK